MDQISCFCYVQEIYRKWSLCSKQVFKNEVSNTFVSSIPLHSSKHSWPSVNLAGGFQFDWEMPLPRFSWLPSVPLIWPTFHRQMPLVTRGQVRACPLLCWTKIHNKCKDVGFWILSWTATQRTLLIVEASLMSIHVTPSITASHVPDCLSWQEKGKKNKWNTVSS